MQPTRHDLLALLFPYLASDLVTPAARSALDDLAQLLAPIVRGGFECRLNADPQVDLQQCIVVENGEALVLQSYLQKVIEREQADVGSWIRLSQFVAEWTDPSSLLHKEITEIWLEFDVEAAPETLPLPSLFFGLKQTASNVSSKIAATELALDLLLGRAEWAAWHQNVVRCFSACPEGAFVSHIGVMLSRSAQALRVNVKRLLPAAVAPYLVQVGWQAETDELTRLIVELYAQVDRITVCLDVGEVLFPRVGLECILLQQPPQEARWGQLLDYLAARGLALPHKSEAILAWPGHTNPTTTSTPWPDHLLRASLLQSPDQFTTFERRLSHLKVVYHPAHPLAAKAYLWFGHEWLRFKKEQASTGRSQPKDALPPYQEQVLAYYESTTELYVEHLGTTFQGWLLNGASDVKASNLAFAQRAGIQPGDSILDAGCGVCGPAIDILRSYPDLQIAAITNSPTQKRIADSLLQETGLLEQVDIRIGDYHHLPWAAETFDRVLFLESSGHTENPIELFTEVYRVLRPGGALYIKDAFHCPLDLLSAAEQRSLSAFNRLFVYHTRTLAQTTQALALAGFVQIETQDLTGMVNGLRWQQAIVESRAGLAEYTPFGKAHQANFESWSVFCGEVKTTKPKG